MNRLLVLKEEWAPRNKKTIEEYTKGSGIKAWWNHYCECGILHEWEAVIGIRYNGSNCPICDGRGKYAPCYCKSLENLRPDLAAEWHPKNEIKPNQIGAKSNKKVWWKCEKNTCDCAHDWEATIANRSKGSGCPFCSGRQVCACNSLDKLDPELIARWDFSKNTASPTEVSSMSNKRVWWKCNKSDCKHPHEWEAIIANRSKGSGCPFCSGHRFCPCNSLSTRRPELISEWSDRNELKPHEVSIGSHSNIIWTCHKHSSCDKIHEWNTEVKHRTINNTNCPYCDCKKICYCNSLAGLRPELSLEWNEKNDKKPNQVSIGSHEKYWWVCSQKHEWLTSTINRSRPNGTGCPICAISKGEKFIRNYLEQRNLNFSSQKIFSFKDCKRLSFDFFLPEFNKAVEFDGIQHFKPVDFFGGETSFKRQIYCDKLKNRYCTLNKISLLRIHYKNMNEIEDLLDFFLGNSGFVYNLFSSSYP